MTYSKQTMLPTISADNSRRIPSFVRHQGRITRRQKDALLHYWGHYGLQCQDKLIDFKRIFDNSAPIVCEIGFGMGDSLLACAKANPQLNFVGIEVYRPALGNFLANVADAGLDNVRVFADDAVNVLQSTIPDNSLCKAQLFYPDPWPKRRHHKRRLIQVDFVRLIATKLQNQGYLHMVTDWDDYAKHIQCVMQQLPMFVATEASSGDNGLNQRPSTKFAKRAQCLGHTITELLYNVIT